MRKVFISNMILNKLEPTKYISEDFSLQNKEYQLPISYLINENVQKGDNVAIITAVEKSEDGHINNAEDNYNLFLKEVNDILASREANVEFIEIPLYKDFDSLTFSKVFKQFADVIQNEDRLYADLTFGMKPYSISLFVALAYAQKAAENVEVEQAIYAQKHYGSKRENPISVIYDVSGLFYINSLASNAEPGQKKELDHLLNFIIAR